MNIKTHLKTLKSNYKMRRAYSKTSSTASLFQVFYLYYVLCIFLTTVLCIGLCAFVSNQNDQMIRFQSKYYGFYYIQLQDGFDYQSTTLTDVTTIKMPKIDLDRSRTETSTKKTETLKRSSTGISAKNINTLKRFTKKNVGSQSKDKDFNKHCGEYMKETQLIYTIIPGSQRSMKRSNEIKEDVRICIATQLNFVRFQALQRIANFWQGCISAVIYVNEQHVNSSIAEVTEWLDVLDRDNIVIVYVVARGIYYPVNYLRNMAMDNTKSEFVLPLDVDFVPNRDLEQQLEYYIETGFFDSGKVALVIPAFEVYDNKTMPVSKDEILHGLANKSVRPFHWFWPRAQNATQYNKWTMAKQPYKITYQLEYEPYMLVRRKDSPRYDERFMHRYKNKCIYTFALFKEHYNFLVIPEGFLVHGPHETFNVTSFPLLKECVLKLWRRRSKIVKNNLTKMHRRPRT